MEKSRLNFYKFYKNKKSLNHILFKLGINAECGLIFKVDKLYVYAYLDSYDFFSENLYDEDLHELYFSKIFLDDLSLNDDEIEARKIKKFRTDYKRF